MFRSSLVNSSQAIVGAAACTGPCHELLQSTATHEPKPVAMQGKGDFVPHQYTILPGLVAHRVCLLIHCACLHAVLHLRQP